MVRGSPVTDSFSSTTTGSPKPNQSLARTSSRSPEWSSTGGSNGSTSAAPVPKAWAPIATSWKKPCRRCTSSASVNAKGNAAQ